MLILVCSRDLPPEDADTAEFVRKVDNLFDCFNNENMACMPCSSIYVCVMLIKIAWKTASASSGREVGA